MHHHRGPMPAGYVPHPVPGYQAVRGETDEPVDPWHPAGKHYHWDELPAKPVADDPYASEPFYMSPPMDNFDTYPGYENVGNFEEKKTVACVDSQLPPLSGHPPPVEFDSVASLGEQQCRDALLDSVGQQCCYGKAAARDMKFTQIIPSSALHYVLETYTESRETGYKHEPYRGGPIDSYRGDQPPRPWDVPCEPERLFKDQVKKTDVAHTSSVQACHACQARGFNRCYRCQGIGFVRCHHCHGDGRISRTDAQGHSHRDSCLACGEEGRKRCSTCHGDACVMCKLCRGYRQLRCYIQLTVSFKNHKGEYLVEKTDLPDKLVRHVQGVKIFEQTMEQVWPVTTYPIEDINENSVKLVAKHRASYTHARHLHQRHHLEAVPLTEVHFQWKNTTGQMWVYGKERKVHAPDYPQKLCCGCVIL